GRTGAGRLSAAGAAAESGGEGPRLHGVSARVGTAGTAARGAAEGDLSRRLPSVSRTADHAAAPRSAGKGARTGTAAADGVDDLLRGGGKLQPHRAGDGRPPGTPQSRAHSGDGRRRGDLGQRRLHAADPGGAAGNGTPTAGPAPGGDSG